MHAPQVRSPTPIPPQVSAGYGAAQGHPAAAHVPGAAAPVANLEQQMQHAHLGPHHPSAHHPGMGGFGVHHVGPGPHWRPGAPSSRASSVMSEDLSAVDEEDAGLEREMEELMAAQQRETLDMQRRHNQQMQEKREAMTRRKLERKQSALGGSLGMGSASSMSSLGDHGPSSGRASIDGGHAQGAVSQHGAFVATGRPPKPASHQGLAAHAAGGAGGPAPLQGPAPPGATPPGSPGVAAGTHVAGTHVAGMHHQAYHHAPEPAAHLAHPQPHAPARGRARARTASARDCARRRAPTMPPRSTARVSPPARRRPRRRRSARSRGARSRAGSAPSPSLARDRRVARRQRARPPANSTGAASSSHNKVEELPRRRRRRTYSRTQ